MMIGCRDPASRPGPELPGVTVSYILTGLPVWRSASGTIQPVPKPSARRGEVAGPIGRPHPQEPHPFSHCLSDVLRLLLCLLTDFPSDGSPPLLPFNFASLWTTTDLDRVPLGFNPPFSISFSLSFPLFSVAYTYSTPPAEKLIMLLPSFPYPQPKDGYWSPVTSTLNWCEEVRVALLFQVI